MSREQAIAAFNATFPGHDVLNSERIDQWAVSPPGYRVLLSVNTYGWTAAVLCDHPRGPRASNDVPTTRPVDAINRALVAYREEVADRLAIATAAAAAIAV